jgi:hypothetical protein
MQAVLHVILGAVFDLLPMKLDGAVAMLASDASGRCPDRFRNRHFLPSPFRLAIDHELPALLAAGH